MTHTFTPDRVMVFAAKVFTPDELVGMWELARDRGDTHQAVFYLNVLALRAPCDVPAVGALARALAAIHRARGELLSAMQYEDKAKEVDVGAYSEHEA